VRTAVRSRLGASAASPDATDWLTATLKRQAYLDAWLRSRAEEVAETHAAVAKRAREETRAAELLSAASELELFEDTQPAIAVTHVLHNTETSWLSRAGGDQTSGASHIVAASVPKAFAASQRVAELLALAAQVEDEEAVDEPYAAPTPASRVLRDFNQVCVQSSPHVGHGSVDSQPPRTDALLAHPSVFQTYESSTSEDEDESILRVDGKEEAQDDVHASTDGDAAPRVPRISSTASFVDAPLKHTPDPSIILVGAVPDFGPIISPPLPKIESAAQRGAARARGAGMGLPPSNRVESPPSRRPSLDRNSFDVPSKSMRFRSTQMATIPKGFSPLPTAEPREPDVFGAPVAPPHMAPPPPVDLEAPRMPRHMVAPARLASVRIPSSDGNVPWRAQPSQEPGSTNNSAYLDRASSGFRADAEDKNPAISIARGPLPVGVPSALHDFVAAATQQKEHRPAGIAWSGSAFMYDANNDLRRCTAVWRNDRLDVLDPDSEGSAPIFSLPYHQVEALWWSAHSQEEDGDVLVCALPSSNDIRLSVVARDAMLGEVICMFARLASQMRIRLVAEATSDDPRPVGGDALAGGMQLLLDGDADDEKSSSSDE
jgi:hypothetical protein